MQQITGQKILLQRGVGETEFLLVWPHDKGCRPQIFLEDFAIRGAINAFPIRAGGDEPIQPVLNPLIAKFAHPAPRQLRRQMLHQHLLVRQAELMLGVIASQPAFDEQTVQHRRVNGLSSDFALFQRRQFSADMAE